MPPKRGSFETSPYRGRPRPIRTEGADPTAENVDSADVRGTAGFTEAG